MMKFEKILLKQVYYLFNRCRITRLTLGDRQEEVKDKQTEDKVMGEEEPPSEGVKTTCMIREEDDIEGGVIKKHERKVGEEYDRLQPGCWGEKGPRLVMVPGLQP